MKKTIFLGVVASLGVLASSSAFALTLKATAKTYYCTGASFSTGDEGSCGAPNNTSKLLPTSVSVSQAVSDKFDGEFGTDKFLGAVLGGDSSTPPKMWAYRIGNSVPDGVLLKGAPVSLTTTDGSSSSISVSVNYIPCGTTTPGDAAVTSSVTTTGLAMGPTAIAITNSKKDCSEGGQIYLTFNVSDALSDGFVKPGDYTGTLAFEVKPLSAG